MNTDVTSARELLASSERIRSDLVSAVAKLDSYIEQLKAVMPSPDIPAELVTTQDLLRTLESTVANLREFTERLRAATAETEDGEEQ